MVYGEARSSPNPSASFAVSMFVMFASPMNETAGSVESEIPVDPLVVAGPGLGSPVFGVGYESKASGLLVVGGVVASFGVAGGEVAGGVVAGGEVAGGEVAGGEVAGGEVAGVAGVAGSVGAGQSMRSA
jgi:hypothetical protein